MFANNREYSGVLRLLFAGINLDHNVEKIKVIANDQSSSTL